MAEETEGVEAGDASLATAGCVAMLAFGALQIGAGWFGLAETFGTGWAVMGLAALLLFRFSLPITVGAFFCARDVWEWHWALALLFAAPGLALLIPGVIAAFTTKMKR